MKKKFIFFGLFLVSGIVILGFVMSRKNVNDSLLCDPEAKSVMNNFLLGEAYSSVLVKIREANMKYVVWADGMDVIDVDEPGTTGRLEVSITLEKKDMWSLTGRKEKITLEFDRSQRLERCECTVVFIGP
ncbi:hypothetical protein [Undibacterium flavidum]|uniref:Uncharacterized protein n=1 Tax=Undibacterium flavidum TaxID=2762297 RepID=A0ABR6YEC4_9BURK|nr:hypothetical protein [Undibacterium flavidum]MBC3874913.1 hypothetical protein [Undibacterium flavidum]